jgi:hypothetical protein
MKKIFVFVLMVTAWASGLSLAQGVRKPVWAGQFYEADKAALSALLDEYFAAAKPDAAPPGKIRGIIVPHAGYIYSGKTAAAAYRLVRGLDIDTVVILGPSHRVGFEGCSIYPQGGFETPLGVAAEQRRADPQPRRAEEENEPGHADGNAEFGVVEAEELALHSQPTERYRSGDGEG